MPTLADHAVLADLSRDVRAAARLLHDDDPLRAYLDMLAALPADPDAWLEVLAPWLDDARRGLGPELDGPGRLAAAGALGIAALRASRELPPSAPLAAVLRAAARWLFFLVDPTTR